MIERSLLGRRHAKFDAESDASVLDLRQFFVSDPLHVADSGAVPTGALSRQDPTVAPVAAPTMR